MRSIAGGLVDFIVRNGLIPQLLLLVGVWGTALFLVVTHQDVPSWLQDAALTILGYFFHVASTALASPGS
jgi:hypothetical protein